MNIKVLRRTLGGHRLASDTAKEASGSASAHVLDCLALTDPSTGNPTARVFFSADLDPERILPDQNPAILETRSIAGGVVLTLERAGDDAPVTIPVRIPVTIPMRAAGKPVGITATLPETDLFAGLNCAVAERNGESAETVRDWLLWHMQTHGLQGALILDRGKPGQSDRFARKLQSILGKGDKGDKRKAAEQLRIVVLSCPVPLGKPDHPPESHPISAPDAPGKDRMARPDSDPWSAPLNAISLYELLRWRFLGRARAVMNIDVYDILPEPEAGKTVFDHACDASQGVVALAGERVYPWSLRKNKAATFGDHICARFDNDSYHGRWCIAPAKAPDAVTWRLVRLTGATVGGQAIRFYRCMALRHQGEGRDADKVSKIVPKSSLVETDALLALAKRLGGKPLRLPEVSDRAHSNDRVAIVTTMKNEGPFILEWLAYHRAIGVDDFLVYTNDCDDGTDTMLQLLQDKGLVQHRDNPFRKTDMKPQHAALAAAEDEPLIKNAGWVICMDVDEFISIHVGDGTLAALFAAVPDANMISLTWRLFGNADVEEFKDELITERFTRCAPEMTRKPHQAWGFKTLFRHIGLFKKLGVHRPKGLKPQLVDKVNWVNGSGQAMPKKDYRNAWRSTTRTIGYDLVTLNHYALRSAESFLVKRDRGRVNHVDRDQGLAYWFRMNNNAETDTAIQRMLPALRAEYDALLSDPDIAAAHAHSVARHRTRIDELRATTQYSDFYSELISDRLRGLSRQHLHFGSAVFLIGPECIPDDFPQGDLPKGFLFTVPKGDTSH